MDILQAREEYSLALKAAQKELKECIAAGREPHPAILDDILSAKKTQTVVDVGLVEIPTRLIAGTKASGRSTAFTATFLPLLGMDTEFAYKWVHLCAAHLSEGIREPIVCYEYLGKFYVQEGNKRVSVLRYFDAPRIPGVVKRILPGRSRDPRVKVYREFLKFYEGAGLYDIQFRRTGDYGKLLSALGKAPGDPWTEEEQRLFRAYFQYFTEAFQTCNGDSLNLLPEEALLLWLRIHSYRDLGKLSGDQLKKTVEDLWEDMVTLSRDEPVQVATEPAPEHKPGLFSILLPVFPDHLNVAFVHQRDVRSSTWIAGHEQGARYLKEVMGDKVTVRSYFHADTPEEADSILEQAVEEGADVVFTTTPPLSRPALRAAVKYPKVRFLNCSVDAPYSSVRTYYSRIYEGKFITGAIAGAMSDNNTIGYIGSNPIFGVPASINAFALGALMTNPRAVISLRWSCVEENPVEAFLREGIRVVSNRDVPTPGQKRLEHGSYGTYFIEPNGNLLPLASPCWMWGKFYEHVVRSILCGSWDDSGKGERAVNYWWGMSSGVIDVTLSKHLPEGLRQLAWILRKGLQKGTIDPFKRLLIDQSGRTVNDGSRRLTAEELLHMDWLCNNVEGHIPTFDEILPYSRNMVRELGIYRDQIPPEKEGGL